MFEEFLHDSFPEMTADDVVVINGRSPHRKLQQETVVRYLAGVDPDILLQNRFFLREKIMDDLPRRIQIGIVRNLELEVVADLVKVVRIDDDGGIDQAVGYDTGLSVILLDDDVADRDVLDHAFRDDGSAGYNAHFVPDLDGMRHGERETRNDVAESLLGSKRDQGDDQGAASQ